MFYLDASVVVAAISFEPRSEDAWRLLNRYADAIVASHWTWTEVASAIAIKARTGAINSSAYADAERERRDMSRETVTLDITRRDFEVAADYVARPELTLRAGDALHLAIARAHNCTVLTFDRQMAAAANGLGIQVNPSSTN